MVNHGLIQISLEVNRLSTARFLPRPPNHHRPLSIETPNFHPSTSSEWLAENGLKARNLNLFQVVTQKVQIYMSHLNFTVSQNAFSLIHLDKLINRVSVYF